jgi:hypothetical protein
MSGLFAPFARYGLVSSTPWMALLESKCSDEWKHRRCKDPAMVVSNEQLAFERLFEDSGKGFKVG